MTENQSSPWGKLGNIALNYPIAPISYTLDRGYGYAQMDRLSGRASIQQVPDALLKVSLKFRCHWLEGNQSPAEYLALFTDLAESKEAAPLTVGGNVLANFVVENIQINHELFTKEGDLLEVAWQVRLLEFADQVEQKRSKKTGFLKRTRTA